MYQHILVATDLASDNQQVIQRAVAIAKNNNARLSLIHVSPAPETFYSAFTGVVNICTDRHQQQILDERGDELKHLLEQIDYPCCHKLLCTGDLSDQICRSIKEYSFDLLICGHHHSLFKTFSSAARQLMEHVQCDLLVVPIFGDDSLLLS